MFDHRNSFQDCVRHYYLSKKDVKYKQLLRKSNKRTRSTKNLPKSNESQSLLDLMTTGVTTRLQRKSRNTTTTRTTATSSAAASAAESQTTNSTARASAASSAPLPTVTVTVNSNLQSQEVVKEEVDPLCIRSMSETNSSSPAPAARRASSNGNQSNEATSFANATKIKSDPDGDVVMKTEPEGNNWYPPNGLNVKHEFKPEEIKQEEKSSGADDAAVKEESGDKKVEIKKENDDKENEDGKSKVGEKFVGKLTCETFQSKTKTHQSWRSTTTIGTTWKRGK
jgi:hypothetical protein